ncbi:MAG TPA: flagellar motor protein MotB, partial [Acidimicrobiia bacterium]|nr:flagellar motor protein MotB [Acidimicrobiia bacterium]
MSGGGGADSRWLITYGDLVTLLMAFFIALYGISHSDSKKF